jgi:hypothetical protein
MTPRKPAATTWRGVARHLAGRWTIAERPCILRKGDIVLREAKKVYKRKWK